MYFCALLRERNVYECFSLFHPTLLEGVHARAGPCRGFLNEVDLTIFANVGIDTAENALPKRYL